MAVRPVRAGCRQPDCHMLTLLQPLPRLPIPTKGAPVWESLAAADIPPEFPATASPLLGGSLEILSAVMNCRPMSSALSVGSGELRANLQCLAAPKDVASHPAIDWRAAVDHQPRSWYRITGHHRVSDAGSIVRRPFLRVFSCFLYMFDSKGGLNPCHPFFNFSKAEIATFTEGLGSTTCPKKNWDHEHDLQWQVYVSGLSITSPSYVVCVYIDWMISWLTGQLHCSFYTQWVETCPASHFPLKGKNKNT